MEERFVVVTEEAAYSFIQNALPEHFVGSTSFSVNILTVSRLRKLLLALCMNDLMESKHTNFPVEQNYALILFRKHGSIPRGLLFASQNRSVPRTNIRAKFRT